MNPEPDRIKIRNTFFEAWRKYNAKEPLQPLEQQLIDIILQHPEYQPLLNQPQKYLNRDYSPVAGGNQSIFAYGFTFKRYRTSDH